ncbi:MAG: hypothetical protein QOD26_3845 [Betaproteobacteria bacterium]|nr:hypothetical protein [Betaproteobacteria bacterium]
MSPWPRAELRAGLCPDRLILGGEIVAGEPLAELKKRAAGRGFTVVLSNHYVRYAVLPASKALRSKADWQAYARHVLEATYGPAAGRWEIRVNDRVAAAVDAALLQELRAIPGLRSVQPYFMAAFNARRKQLRGKSAWFVVQERGRLTLALLQKESWQVIRTRQAGSGWAGSLADLLERESAAADAPDCTQAVLCAEDEPPARAGRYEIVDLTPVARAHAMVLQ